MATSGTIGQTVVDVTTLIEHAVRRCGVSATSITAEQQLSAKENLFFALTNLSNRGVNLWCVQKTVLGLSAGETQYQLPLGVIDVLTALRRKVALATATVTTTATAITGDAGVPTAVATVGVTVSAATTLTPVIEVSPDGLTWTTVGTSPAFSAVPGVPYWLDVDPIPTVEFWRVRETVLASAPFATLSLGTAPSEIQCAKLNRDDYVNLPNKTFQGDPLQFWFDKQVDPARVWLWPVPSDGTATMLSLWLHRQIQDVGDLTNQLSVPARWYEAVISMLAPLVCLELPKDTVPADRYDKLVAIAEVKLRQAEDGERDGAPIRWAPNISAYTR